MQTFSTLNRLSFYPTIPVFHDLIASWLDKLLTSKLSYTSLHASFFGTFSFFALHNVSIRTHPSLAYVLRIRLCLSPKFLLISALLLIFYVSFFIFLFYLCVSSLIFYYQALLSSMYRNGNASTHGKQLPASSTPQGPTRRKPNAPRIYLFYFIFFVSFLLFL